MRSASTRHRRRLALAPRQRLAEVLDELLAMRQAGAGIGRLREAASAGAACALDGKAQAPGTTGTGEFVATHHVLGSAV